MMRGAGAVDFEGGGDAESLVLHFLEGCSSSAAAPIDCMVYPVEFIDDSWGRLREMFSVPITRSGAGPTIRMLALGRFSSLELTRFHLLGADCGGGDGGGSVNGCGGGEGDE
jgi:hypothetical protein